MGSHITAPIYYYNYSPKQHVSALLGHHQAYKRVVLVKVHSMILFCKPYEGRVKSKHVA